MCFASRPRLQPIRATLCLSLFLAATPASAEWFADLYGGGAYTPRSDVTLVVRPPGVVADHTFHDVKWDPSATYGARAGVWFDAVPWYGVGLDVFRYSANIPTQTVDTTILGTTAPATLQAIDVSVTAIAFDVLRLRYPVLVSPEYPRGRFQPYLTAGPAIFKVRATNTTNGELTTQPGTDSSTGYKLGAGLFWQLTRGAAVFGEYRYTHVHTEPVLQGALTGLRVPLQFNLDTHHVVAGVSFSF